MVWEQDVRVIVMLTALSEGGHVKCHAYWQPGKYGTLELKLLSEKQVPLETRGRNSAAPPRSPQTRRPSVGLRRSTNPNTAAEKQSISQDQTEPPHIRIRHLALSDASSPFQPIRQITQLQYSHWPDFGTPTDPTHILQLIEQCDRATLAISSPGSSFQPEVPASEKQRPVMVHCSAGCGRTGAFCTVDSVIDMVKRQHFGQPMSPVAGANIELDREQDVDLIAQTVEDFRLQRLSMVQTLRQFVLCYESILEWFTAQTRSPIAKVLPSSSSSSRLYSLKRDEGRRSFHA